MKKLIGVVLFSLLTVGFFSGFSYFGIPQIEPAPPPKEEALHLTGVSLDEFIALGGDIVDGKGTCTLCHNEVGGRAPLLNEVGQMVTDRITDEGYRGKAVDVETYLYESMVEPSAYVVAGFGKAGTDDTVSPMPNVRTGSIGLSEAEIAAVIAYLQDANSLAVTVEVPTDAIEAGADKPEESGEARPLFETPEEIIAEFGCGACHLVADEEGEMGPDLRQIGALRDAEYLRRAILEPNAEIAEGFEAELMPVDYGEQLYATELETLVDYLAGLK